MILGNFTRLDWLPKNLNYMFYIDKKFKHCVVKHCVFDSKLKHCVLRSKRQHCVEPVNNRRTFAARFTGQTNILIRLPDRRGLAHILDKYLWTLDI